MGIANKPGLSEEKAARMMAALRGGRTLRSFGVKASRLQSYFETHPEYVREALPLIEANAKAAQHRKGGYFSSKPTHCRAGLHPMMEDNVFIDGTNGRRRCLACRRASVAYAPLMSEEVAEKVKLALQRGASLSQITHGKPTGGGKTNLSLVIASFKVVKRYRQENPEFDRFVAEAIADSNAVGQRIRHHRRQNAMKREESNDYFRIRAMLPEGFPGKDDVVSDIFEAILNGSLQRADVRARVRTYISVHNRMFPTKFAKFGGSPLVSLDEVLFDDRSATRGDTISRGLWN